MNRTLRLAAGTEATKLALTEAVDDRLTGDGIRVAVTGAGPSVFRVAEMEQALAADFSADAVANITIAADGLNSDIHASAEYRAHLVSVMAKRAVAAA
jgi:carbon-monoxide dehydrogenase medium subunit